MKNFGAFLPVTAIGAYFVSVPRSGSPMNEGRSKISAVAVTLPAGSGGKKFD